jgi:flagellar basal body-associated protein FliL
MSDAKPEGEGGPPKPAKPGVPVPVLALLVLNLGATGFVATKVMHPPPIHIAKEKPEAHSDKPGPVYTMDPFVVNLNESTSSRFLKAGFEVECVDESTVKALDTQKRAVRDEVLRYLSGLSVADTLGEENKEKIGETLVARIDKAIGGHNMVKKMYFTEFMVQ